VARLLWGVKQKTPAWMARVFCCGVWSRHTAKPSIKVCPGGFSPVLTGAILSRVYYTAKPQKLFAPARSFRNPQTMWKLPSSIRDIAAPVLPLTAVHRYRALPIKGRRTREELSLFCRSGYPLHPLMGVARCGFAILVAQAIYRLPTS
jgi:hypothetical protein